MLKLIQLPNKLLRKIYFYFFFRIKIFNKFSLGAEDANRLLTSTSTTVIRTEAKATGETHVAGSAVVLGTTATNVEKSSSSHSTSSATATKQ
jgi:hypothetical protein